jgi:hypothetical protein
MFAAARNGFNFNTTRRVGRQAFGVATNLTRKAYNGLSAAASGVQSGLSSLATGISSVAQKLNVDFSKFELFKKKSSKLVIVEASSVINKMLTICLEYGIAAKAKPLAEKLTILGSNMSPELSTTFGKFQTAQPSAHEKRIGDLCITSGASLTDPAAVTLFIQPGTRTAKIGGGPILNALSEDAIAVALIVIKNALYLLILAVGIPTSITAGLLELLLFPFMDDEVIKYEKDESGNTRKYVYEEETEYLSEQIQQWMNDASEIVAKIGTGGTHKKRHKRKHR